MQAGCVKKYKGWKWRSKYGIKKQQQYEYIKKTQKLRSSIQRPH